MVPSLSLLPLLLCEWWQGQPAFGRGRGSCRPDPVARGGPEADRFATCVGGHYSSPGVLASVLRPLAHAGFPKAPEPRGGLLSDLSRTIGEFITQMTQV